MTGPETRLLGAGRLAVTISADWPVEVDPARTMRRSTVVLPGATTPAGHVWSALDGAVGITLDHFPPLPFEQSFRPVGPEAETILLESGDRVVRTTDTRQTPDGSGSRTCTVLTAPTLGGRFTIDGPTGDVERIAGTAQLVPEGLVAVPNVLVGMDPLTQGLDGAPSPEKRARQIVERAGLVFRASHPLKPGGGKRRTIALAGTQPAGGTVVPQGTVVVARFVRVR